jgi:hypothetical protein
MWLSQKYETAFFVLAGKGIKLTTDFEKVAVLKMSPIE